MMQKVQRPAARLSPASRAGSSSPMSWCGPTNTRGDPALERNERTKLISACARPADWCAAESKLITMSVSMPVESFGPEQDEPAIVADTLDLDNRKRR